MSSQPATVPKRPRVRSTPEVRRKQFIEAGVRCLRERGIQGLTLKNVAQMAGGSLGLISHYFEGREGFLFAVYEHLLAGLPQLEPRSPVTHAECIELVVGVVEDNFRPELFSREDFPMWLLLYAEMISHAHLRKKMLASQGAYSSTFATYLAALARHRSLTLDAEKVAWDFIAYVDGLWMQWCLSMQADPTLQKAAAYEFLVAHVGALRNIEDRQRS